MSVDRGGERVPPSPPPSASSSEPVPVPVPVPPSDAELIERMRDGDDTAYEELFRRHSGAVRRYARTCCRDADTADDLTAEVFARMLQAVRGGSGPAHAVRPYLLTTVRRVAARWTASARREQLVDDFAVFAAQVSAARGRGAVEDVGGAGPEAGSFGAGTELGADVRAMHAAEQSLAVRAFRSLPERWQAVLWHTEVEDESPSEVAVLFGLDANGTRVLASRAREGLRQAYLQAHVSESLAGDQGCARYAEQLGAYVRGRLRTRAERGVREHLERCARCRVAASQLGEVAGGIPAVVPVAVVGWFGVAGYGKVAGLVAGGGAGAGGGAPAGGSGGGGGAAVSEGVGASVKAGVAVGVVAAVVAVVALALTGGHGEKEREGVAGAPPSSAGPSRGSAVVRPGPVGSSGVDVPRSGPEPGRSAGSGGVTGAAVVSASARPVVSVRPVESGAVPAASPSVVAPVPGGSPSGSVGAVPSASPSGGVLVRVQVGGVLGVEVGVRVGEFAPAAPTLPVLQGLRPFDPLGD
ncbi:sigma-70 family RNA polymerase sigma factor [Streptomyces sp. NRRL F-6676]|uniref:sigma-70 family RNA polymerase sigma factor n=1 Tax=Streptomyces sp. NRRL F-6676 TaxID=1463878 RepID=UPI00099C658D|nr:sigma-70 family RNA polymerase sigma factor [Streptomyces sp. NRRL F-6676]